MSAYREDLEAWYKTLEATPRILAILINPIPDTLELEVNVSTIEGVKTYHIFRDDAYFLATSLLDMVKRHGD
jgi:hypothetical protein